MNGRMKLKANVDINKLMKLTKMIDGRKMKVVLNSELIWKGEC